MKVTDITCGSSTCTARLTVSVPNRATMTTRVNAVMDALKRSDWRIVQMPDDDEARAYCGRCRRLDP